MSGPSGIFSLAPVAETHTPDFEAPIGLSLALLHCVFHAIILNKTLYAISARYGFLNKSHVSQIYSLFKRAFGYGYVKTVFNLEQLLQNYDDNLLT